MRRHRRIRSSHLPPTESALAAMCEGKYGYPRMHYARAVAGRYKARGRGPLEAYRCLACGLYHVGHPRTFTDVKDATYDAGRERARQKRDIRRIVEGL